jgi:hypothetical protein
MPKKNSIINNNPEKILIEDEIPQEEEFIKPKRQISDAQREHLNNIRSKALEKKAQMKEETLKAKLAKIYEKKELVKKYDDYIEKEKEKEKEIPQPAEKKGDIKPKKEKTIVYKLAETSSSDSSSDDEEEEKVVYVKKYKNKNKNKQKVYSEPKRETLDSTLYKSSQEMLHSRAIEERVRSNLVKWNNAMMPQEY